MTRRLVRIAQAIRLEMAEIRRSRWLAVTLLVYSVLIGIFVLVGLRESSVLGFTGLGRVFLNFSHALILLLPLLSLSATAQVIPRARDDGTLELLMSQPLSRSDYFAGVAISRIVVLVAPLIALAVGVAAFGGFVLGQDIPWGYLGSMLLAATTLIVAFVGIGLLISTTGRSQSRTLIYALVTWAAGVALLDFALIGMMLQWRLSPETVFTLAALNPVQDARFLLLSAAEPELSILGPVGFFMVNRLGAHWPTLVGLGTLYAAWSHFKRADLLG